MPATYRDRIYSVYVSGRSQALAPASIAGLAPRVPGLRQVVRRHFPADKRAPILELGCGHGALLYVARREGYRNLRGVDASPQQVAAARRLGIEGVVEGDVLTTLRETPAASLGAVVAFDVIEHFTKDELLTLVDEVFRVLMAGGKWIIHTVNGASPFFGSSLYHDFTHEIAFESVSIAQLLLSSGFGNVTSYDDAPAVHGLKSAVRAGLWQVIRRIFWAITVVETGAVRHDAIYTRNFIAVAVK